MDRRQFFTAAAASLAAGSSFGFDTGKTRRVGLIGSGWYGKCDLFRLIQVAPVEVVSLCDVDKQMLGEAADMIARGSFEEEAAHLRRLPRDAQGEGSRHRADRHAGSLARAADDRRVEAGVDVYCQKPISVDVVEGQAMLAAARKHKRVVQVGTQRRSTPHLIEARDQIIKEGKLGKIAQVEICCYYHMRATGNPPDTAPPENLDYEMWTGPAPMRPYNKMVHPRGWRAFMEYGNGIVGDMCVHMLDMVRWMLDLGWPKRVSSRAASSSTRASKANISDTQTATFDYRRSCKSSGRIARGATRPIRSIHGARRSTATRARSRRACSATISSRMGGGKPIHKDVTYEFDQYPEDRTEKDLERHVAPGDSRPHEGFAGHHRLRAASRWPTSSRATFPRRAASSPTCR